MEKPVIKPDYNCGKNEQKNRQIAKILDTHNLVTFIDKCI